MPNRLSQSTSPYLLQHKDNPVDWLEWSQEAFDEARERDVPVLLSVGYAACHWCHVMAHESFEDQATARLMNEMFVNVKVDREERPDVDSIYMESVQAMTGRGGWPMTVWLDHDGRPFYAGTYFPDQPRHGMPSFSQVIGAVSDAWVTRRDQVAEQAENLIQAISREIPEGDLLDQEGLANAYRQIAAGFDSTHGGFGGAPKFPQQPVLEFLLRIHDEDWAPEARLMLTKTLEEMAAGGIHDQIGGGFARYSVDAHWLVPHFEKMLYDNAQLARLYLWAGIEFSKPEFITVAKATLGYLARDLRDKSGGFFSSEDADSEGEEGKFYVWGVDEVLEVLGDDAAEIIEFYGVTEEGNFEGTNILNVVREVVPGGLEEANRLLLAERSKRIRPALDDKIIASWNGLAIRAFAEAGAALNDKSLIRIAEDAARFVVDNLIVDGRLQRSWRAGRTSVPAFLDDHASMAVGLLMLYAATGNSEWYDYAMALMTRLDDFSRESGGFFGTSKDGEALIKRPTDSTDNPLPSGNALAAETLFLSGLYTGEAKATEEAQRALASVALLMRQYPSMVGRHLAVLHSMGSSKELAIAGEDWQTLAAVHWSRFRPNVALATSEGAASKPPLLANRHQEGTTLAYVCHGFVCDLPTEDPSVLAGLL